MKSKLVWKSQMEFEAETQQHRLTMDSRAPLGKDRGMTPKELVVCGLAGCTAMDVVALMKKHKQELTSFEVDADVEVSKGAHPLVFTRAHLNFRLAGQVDTAIVLESVRLSQTKYCGVSAMLSKALPITYSVYVNERLIGEGQAQFE